MVRCINTDIILFNNINELNEYKNKNKIFLYPTKLRFNDKIFGIAVDKSIIKDFIEENPQM